MSEQCFDETTLGLREIYETVKTSVSLALEFDQPLPDGEHIDRIKRAREQVRTLVEDLDPC